MSDKIKWKDFEGTPEDITKFFELSKLDVKKYMPSDKNEKVLNIILIVLGCLILGFFILLQFLTGIALARLSMIFFFFLIVTLFFIHRRWESTSLTIISAILALIIYIVGVGIATPDSALKVLIEIINKSN